MPLLQEGAGYELQLLLRFVEIVDPPAEARRPLTEPKCHLRMTCRTTAGTERAR